MTEEDSRDGSEGDDLLKEATEKKYIQNKHNAMKHSISAQTPDSNC